MSQRFTGALFPYQSIDLSKNLNALIENDFVVKYVPFGLGKRCEHYKLIDPFCIFYLHFIDSHRTSDERFWTKNVSSPSVLTWQRYAFENVCFNHVPQIKSALGVSGVSTMTSAWSGHAKDKNALIDLLLSRNDNVANMCEIQFCDGDFTVDKAYFKTILERQEMLAKEVSPKNVVRSTLITTFRLEHNRYGGVFTNVVLLDDLFKE